jgi:hypothetical protein
MRSKYVAIAVVLSGGVLWTALPANAQTLYLLALPVASTGASGSYQAKVTEVTPTLFDVSVVGDDNGNLTAKHSVDQISFTFVGDNVVSGLGGTNAAWLPIATGSTMTYSDTSANPVDAFGANRFSGSADLASAFTTNGEVKLALQDDGQQWNVNGFFNNTQVVPESGSMVLMLSAMLPLMLMVKKRRRTLPAALVPV